MKPEPLSNASEKRRKLERELIGSLAGNLRGHHRRRGLV